MRLIQLATVVLTMALGSALHADSAHDEELDPSMLRIESGQYSALLGRASQAADIVFANDKHDADVDDKCGSGVKSTALELLALRNKLADKKHMLPSQALRMKVASVGFRAANRVPISTGDSAPSRLAWDTSAVGYRCGLRRGGKEDRRPSDLFGRVKLAISTRRGHQRQVTDLPSASCSARSLPAPTQVRHERVRPRLAAAAPGRTRTATALHTLSLIHI